MILEKLKNFINKNNLQDSKIAIACSGGIDSLVLLDAIAKIHPLDLLYCLHLDHGWQASSRQAFELVQSYCTEHSISFKSKVYQQDEMNKTEAEARKKRYEFFEEESLALGVKAILLAHNLNDNVETVLFRVFRGTGTAGLCGIPETRELNSLKIYRPFLYLERELIEKYASESGLNYFHDSSNEDVNYARNRIRQNILPEALKLNPQVLNNINQLSELVNEEQEFMANHVAAAFTQLGALPWSLEEFRQLDKVIQRKILEKVFCPNIEFVNKFLAAIKEGGFHRINFKKEKFFTIKQKKILLEEGL